MKPSLVVFAAALAAASCTKSTNTAVAPTTPATRTTDTFSGTVAVKSSDAHSFTVASSGQVDVTLTSATPALPMGVSVGTTSASGCAAVAGGSAVASAGTTAQLSGVMSPATYCVAVFDIGNATQAVAYTVTVAHP